MKKHMKKFLAMMMSACIMAGCLAGCGTPSDTGAQANPGASAPDSTPDSGAKKDLKFAYIVYDTTSIYQVFIDGFKKACNENGIEPVIVSYEGDSAKWPEALENAAAMNVDAIYTWPADTSMADYAGQYCANAGIPCVSMGIASDYADCSLLADQVGMGQTLAKQAADWVAEHYGDKEFEWALLEYTSASNCAERSQAMEDTMLELCPNGTQVAALEATNLEEGMNQAENLIQMHPNVQLVICCEDTAAMGAVEVFRAAGKAGDDYAIFGACFGDQVGNAILKGDVYRESVAFEDFGALAVPLMQKLVNGEAVDKEVYGGFISVNPENVKEVMEQFGYAVVE